MRSPTIIGATVDRSFRSLGTTVRVRVCGPDAAARAATAEALVRDYDRRLSRFRPDSELSRLNGDPREAVPASPLLRDAIRAALWAATTTGGLVDPTILPALEAAGYRNSWSEDRAAFGMPVETRPAEPDPAARWRAIDVDAAHVIRPAGMRLDLGGTGKGHVADLVAKVLDGAPAWAIDCGGDVRVGGATPQRVVVAHPFGKEEAASYDVATGAVATSSIHARAWRRPDGRPAHHLIDPSTGEPAHTGLIAVTALAPSTLEAETTAKAALLGGPEAARATVARGVLVHADGTTEHLG